MKKNTLNIVLFVFSLIFHSSYDLLAQGKGRGNGNIDPGKSTTAPGRNKGSTGVPIDGGASILLAAGAAYGLKKLNDFRLRQKTMILTNNK